MVYMKRASMAFQFIFHRTSIRKIVCNCTFFVCPIIMRGFIPTTMMVIGVALLGLAVAIPAPTYDKVHEQMTPEEIKQVFQTAPHAVPEYEIMALQWPRLHKRAYGSATHIRLNAFGRDVPLWLHPIDGVLAGYDTPVYYARADQRDNSGVRFARIRDPISVACRYLEDKDRKATLAVKQAANGRNLISGRIGSEDWTIRPLPNRIHDQYYGRYQRSINDFDYTKNFTIAEYDEPHYHVIFKNPVATEGTEYASLPIDPSLLNSQSSRSKRAAGGTPSVVYPQLLVVADYATFQLHNKDTYGLLEYLIPFWNSVDLRYRGLEYPKMRLNIAGIIIEAEPNAIPYIRDHRVNSEKLNIYGALEFSGEFRRNIESIIPLDSTDIMVTMSPYDMCAPTKNEGCKSGTLGLAYVGGACKNYDYPSPKTVSVTVIHDKGAFDGVHTAAHELGHLFGANHDGVEEASCAAAVGHIMAGHPVLTENSADWSPCSLRAFDTFFKEQNPECLFNKPETDSPVPRILPGRLMTMDEQCQKIEGTKACNDRTSFMSPAELAKYEREVCLSLKCVYKKDSNYCTGVGDAPADGTICGDGKVCLHGKCILQSDFL